MVRLLCAWQLQQEEEEEGMLPSQQFIEVVVAAKQLLTFKRVLPTLTGARLTGGLGRWALCLLHPQRSPLALPRPGWGMALARKVSEC